MTAALGSEEVEGQQRKAKGLPLTPALSPNDEAVGGEGDKRPACSLSSGAAGGEGWGEGEAFAFSPRL